MVSARAFRRYLIPERAIEFQFDYLMWFYRFLRECFIGFSAFFVGFGFCFYLSSIFPGGFRFSYFFWFS